MKSVEIQVGKSIKKLRKEKGISLSKLSELSKVQIATLSRIEHNKMINDNKLRKSPVPDKIWNKLHKICYMIYTIKNVI
mgnify:CR=1 FL=1